MDAAVRRWGDGHRAPGARDRQRLAERVAAELETGGDETVILDEMTRDLGDVWNALGVMFTRMATPGWGRSMDPRPDHSRYEVTGPRPVWCGVCDERTRLVAYERRDGSEGMRRCRRCHPNEAAQAAAQAAAGPETTEVDESELDGAVLEQMRASLGTDQSSDDGDTGGLTPVARAAADSVRQLLAQQQ